MVQPRCLVYSFVARGAEILAEYTDVISGNFSSIAVEWLKKLPATDDRFTYVCDGHSFNYLVHNGFTYCIVAIESTERHISIAFLERIKEDFTKRYSGGKATNAVAKSLNKDFGPKMKAHMQYCVDHPEESSKVMQVKAQVSEVKAVMMENIIKEMERGDKLDDLVVKTEDLQNQALGYKKIGTQVKRKMWCQNMKIKMIVLAIIIILVLIIVLSICRGFAC